MDKIGRKKKVILNASFSALSEIVSFICALILPRLILSHFGSTYNGIINSITQFISFVTLLRAGVGGVTRAALYKPLADGNTEKISSIIVATEIFMRKVAMLYLALMFGIATIYPFIVHEFDWFFSFSLFVIIGITTFAQYYFGITYQMLLLADQKNYIYTIFNIVSVILNTLLGSLLIVAGFGIHAVKLASTVAFALTPICLNIYVRKHYNIDKSVQADTTALSQRWDALGHQIAYYIFTSTDLTVLTILANVKYVSVYSVYHLPIKAIKTIIKTYSSSIEAAFGNVIAKKQAEVLDSSFKAFECFMCLSCSWIFGCTVALIVPFVRIYTKGVTDFNYVHPVFALLIVLGEMFYCLRIPYMSVVEASGFYKQTKRGAYLESFLNISISIVLCLLIDPLIAVATGTLIAMGVRTIEISRFVDLFILNRSRFSFYRSVFICVAMILVSATCSNFIFFSEINTYYSWLITAVIYGVINLLLVAFIAILFYRKDTKQMIKALRSMIIKR